MESAETKEVIEGLRFVFIELPKFTPKNYGDKKMQVLWLRFLTEIDEKTRKVPDELLDNPDINKAVEQLEESAFSDAQLLGYDRFWDMVSTARTQISSSRRDGMKEGFKQGRELGIKLGREEGIKEGIKEGIEQGIEQGHKEERLKMARGMKEAGMPADVISRITGLSPDDVCEM